MIFPMGTCLLIWKKKKKKKKKKKSIALKKVIDTNENVLLQEWPSLAMLSINGVFLLSENARRKLKHKSVIYQLKWYI